MPSMHFNAIKATKQSKPQNHWHFNAITSNMQATTSIYIGPHFSPHCETKFEAQVEIETTFEFQVEIEVKTEAETESEVHIEAQSSSKLARNVECTPQRCTVCRESRRRERKVTGNAQKKSLLKHSSD